MLLSLLVLLLFSNAVTLRRDKSILFSRIVIVGLLFTSFLAYANIYVEPLYKDITIYLGTYSLSGLSPLNIPIFILLISINMSETLTVNIKNIVISNYISSFILMPEQWFSIVSILTCDFIKVCPSL